MPKNVIQYDLLISCPGDIKEEKEVIQAAVNQFNELYADVLHIAIRTRDWKHSSFPQSGDKPQKLLNEQFVNDCDAAVAIFWSRFGTPTDEFASGTEEEIEIMLSEDKQVFLYFSDAPVSPSLIDSDQYKRVIAFKKKYEDRGIYYTYSSIDAFKEMFFAHLSQFFLSKKTVDSIKEKREPKLKLVGIDSQSNICEAAMVSPFRPTGIRNKQDYISEIVKLYDEINANKLKSRTKREGNSIFGNINLNNSVEIKDEDKELLLKVADQLSITIDDTFFQLGDLSSSLIPHDLYGSHSLIGDVKEKEKYRKIQALKQEIIDCFIWMPIEEAFYNNQTIRLAVQNYGTSFDEDVEVILYFPKNSLKQLHEFPTFDNEQMNYLLNNIEMSDLFGIKSTPQYYDYNESEKAMRYHPRGIHSIPGISEDYSEDYYTELNDIFDYEVYDEPDICVVRLKMEYIKHNTTIAFPSILFLNNKIDSIKYQISSKNASEITKGEIKVAEESIE